MARDNHSLAYHGCCGLEMRPFGTDLKPFCPTCERKRLKEALRPIASYSDR